MNLLSIQSHVAYGHVGNAAAVFPLQRIGVEVWPIHTVQFSNHTGYGAWTGQVFDAAVIGELVRGIEARAASLVFGVLKATAERGSREILPVEAQEELVAPRTLFAPERVGG